MDALDRLAEPGVELLHRVDTLLAAGAPEGHRVWPLLRRMQVLPGEALRSFLDLRAAPLATAGHAVRRHVHGYDHACAALTDPILWSGSAALAYSQSRATLLRHLDEGPESLVGRLEATAGYADALADWVEGSRLAVARALAEVIGSAEAVAVVAATSVSRASTDAGPSSPGRIAAAEVGARVLAVLCVAYDGAENLLRQWSPSLAESPWRPAGARFRPDPGGGTPGGRTTRVGW
ncbi:hypothetical protein SAMN05443287_106162 [Micromonospora phaseoli]|uniref:Uncharacterized protein n=1 Tax=Micromonospora phaseoli TaxID=1144548 RepID=A0A1H7AKF3_9ACTN|nr:hypothetical protein [Micromonospora phaseoli]PZV96348.1 hypothetical protein CLV64_107226 [Micromonospora phaseoli]GIJ76035.1 hypothetical protein Xph01_04670 [Micromonospora phaseoli]SEJ65406.1 hypothetical protein SAMN05443287_106162 [Micromonospora phaseoli]